MSEGSAYLPDFNADLDVDALMAMAMRRKAAKNMASENLDHLTYYDDLQVEWRDDALPEGQFGPSHGKGTDIPMQ